ncbi:MAG: tRNA 5-hydroxyuridine methyltransferase [Legionellaceae bacterium]
MTNRTIIMSDETYHYYLKMGIREPAILMELREKTLELSSHNMQIAPEQGQFMAMLVKLLSAKTIIELGTYTGYSALAMALALPENGKIITCDRDAVATEIAKTYWKKAGVAYKIEFMYGEALASLASLNKELIFDMAFIDADKRNYLAYYEYLLPRMRPGGIILIDNVLWGGRLVDENDQANASRAIRNFNAQLVNDVRIDLCMIPIGDGLTLARKL